MSFWKTWSLAFCLFFIATATNAQQNLAFGYSGSTTPFPMNDMEITSNPDFEGYPVSTRSVSNPDVILVPTNINRNRLVVLYSGENQTSYAMKVTAGYGKQAYQVVQCYPNGARKSLFYLDKKGRFDGYFMIFKRDGSPLYMHCYKHGASVKDWREKHFQKLIGSSLDSSPAKWKGSYSSITRYGNLNLKLEKSGKARYFGYLDNGDYINYNGTWKVDGAYLVFEQEVSEEGIEPFGVRFVRFKRKKMAIVNPYGYWDPDFIFTKK